MTRKLTTAQAWRKIASWWVPKNYRIDEDGNLMIKVKIRLYGTHFMYGLCSGVTNHYSQSFITCEQSREMKAAIKDSEEFQKCDNNFMFPLTKGGARKRRSFCLKQAKLLEKKKPTKKGKG